MDQSSLSKYINYFLKGILSKEKEKELLDWVKQSDENRQLFLAEQKSQYLKLPTKQDPELTKRWKQLKQRISTSDTGLTGRKLYLRIASIAAAVLFGAIISTAILYNSARLNLKLTEQIVSVPFGAKSNVSLPDGTVVWLNSGSTLSYPPEFGKTRLINLEGEAFFDVQKGTKPFIVSTSFGEVEAKGTSFNVLAFNNESLYATLTEGVIAVRLNDDENEVLLEPGQQAFIDNGELKIQKVDTTLFTSWKDGKLIFQKEYLPSLAKRLSRWYNVDIELDDDQRLEELWFTGELEMESFTEVLELLSATSPIEYNYNKNTRTIKIKYHQN
ncbi:FecR domain-containing protein [uncultured Draconibacterium sp.]|uniref:FecR family protein n=1 Tax=uncultured Draconibacterium sp. TaxID=1573823 RepID=UPI0029C7D398|nr:FecR domain-containing protein [uncultured Draconibacterium sp.]